MKRTRGLFFVLVILMLSVVTAWAQFRIPSMDVSLKGGYSILDGDASSEFTGVVVSGSLMIHINENIAVGPFFSKDVNVNFRANIEDNVDFEDKGEQSILGISARFSTSRSKLLRPYLNVSYYSVELVEDYESYRLAGKTNGFGADLGLMIRLNRNLYLNAIEIDFRQLNDGIFFLEGTNYIFHLQTGVTYNFGRKK